MDQRQLDMISVPYSERIDTAIASGKVEEAKAAMKEAMQLQKGFHDFAVKWANMLLNYIGDNVGDDAVWETHKLFAKTFRPPVVAEWESSGADPDKFPLDEFIKQRTSMWHGHDAKFKWQADDDKYTLILTPCESGGRLCEWSDGNKDARMKAEKPYAYNERGFSYYCLHCPTMWELGWIEEYGYPLIIFEPQPDGTCIQHFYKHPSLIPNAYYERRGIKRQI